MKKTLRFTALVMALVMAMSLITFAQAEGNADDVMATADGINILRADVDAINNEMTDYYSYYGVDVADPSIKQQLLTMAVDYAAQTKIVEKKAQELQLLTYTAEDEAALLAEAQAQFDAYVEQYVSYFTTDTTEEALAEARKSSIAMLESYGMSVDDIAKSLRENDVFNRVRSYASKDASVTDEDIKAQYDSKLATDTETYANDVYSYEYSVLYSGQTSYYQPDGYRGIIHILLETDETLLENYLNLKETYDQQMADDAAKEEDADPAAPASEATAEPAPETTAEPVTEEQIEQARLAVIASVQDKLTDIKTRLDNGEDFLKLVDEYGTDNGMSVAKNRDGGYPVRVDSLMYDLAFRDAAFTLQNVGDVSEPVVGSFGVHILKYLRDIPAGPVELTQELSDSIRAELLSTKSDDMYYALIDEWMQAANITYTDILNAEFAQIQAEIDAVAAAAATEEPAAEATEAPAAE
ncbi:MAG: peptidylprolyl isomerase [Eubacteriales bacterium]|nr:peptidylprolyl isomerase [Eubacteriales bacterium]MDD3881215.1 peptidylprolyl isomerase [Eubacteriales bacterium]MDD4512133.1 peptidylprolyl isomerase [Eubacteriales bacterium]